MSKENALMFLEKLRDENALLDHSDSFEALVKGYAAKAKEAGENISEDDFTQALEDALRQRTDQAVADMNALGDDELENVSGGYSYYDNHTGFVDGCIATQDGWCWSDDACYDTVYHYMCDKDWNDESCSYHHICDKYSYKVSQSKTRCYKNN